MTPVRRRCAALSLLLPAILGLAACGGGDDEPGSTSGSGGATATPGPCDPPAGEGAFAPASSYFTFTSGAIGVEYELSDGTTDCKVVDSAKTAGRYEVAGKNTQVTIDLGDRSLGLTIDLASYDAEGDAALAPGAVHGIVGVQVDGHYFPDPAGDQCEVILAELTDTTIAGSFTCKDLAGTTYPGPFGGKATELSATSASGWWRAAK